METPFKSIAVPAGRRLGKTRTSPTATPYAPATADARRQSRISAVHPAHRFHIGDRLSMANGGRTIARVASVCRVVSLLPDEGGPLRYRVRSENEGFERIVDESDLSPLGESLD